MRLRRWPIPTTCVYPVLPQPLTQHLPLKVHLLSLQGLASLSHISQFRFTLQGPVHLWIDQWLQFTIRLDNSYPSQNTTFSTRLKVHLRHVILARISIIVSNIPQFHSLLQGPVQCSSYLLVSVSLKRTVAKGCISLIGAVKILTLPKLAWSPPPNFGTVVDLTTKSASMRLATIDDKARKST